jgi:hypothetical protein
VKNIPERDACHLAAAHCFSKTETIVVDITDIFLISAYPQMFTRVIILDPAARAASITKIFMLKHFFILIFTIG